jgi:hypothetical protein
MPGMDQDVKEVLIFLTERLRAMEAQSDEDSIRINQIHSALQGTPIAVNLKSSIDSAALTVSTRRRVNPVRELDDIIQRLKAL